MIELKKILLKPGCITLHKEYSGFTKWLHKIGIIKKLPYNHITIVCMDYVLATTDSEELNDATDPILVLCPKQAYSKKEKDILIREALLKFCFAYGGYRSIIDTINHIRPNTFNVTEVSSVDRIKDNKYYKVIYSNG